MFVDGWDMGLMARFGRAAQYLIFVPIFPNRNTCDTLCIIVESKHPKIQEKTKLILGSGFRALQELLT